MVTKSKVLDFIMKNIKNLEANWQSKLEDMNVWDDVADLYRIHMADKEKTPISRYESNVCLAFVVLSYDCHSQFLEPHKNRFDNKVKIMSRLAGPSCLTKTLFNEVVYSQENTVNKVIHWYVTYQKDTRWNTILANEEFSAQTTALAMSGRADKDLGRMLKESQELDIQTAKLKEILKNEYLNLDTVLDKENMKKATDFEATNFMSHEGFIRGRESRNKKESATA